MFKVEVRNKKSQKITHAATWDNMDQAQNWIDSLKDTFAWGLPPGWFSASDAMIIGYDTADALEERDFEISPAIPEQEILDDAGEVIGIQDATPAQMVHQYRFGYAFDVVVTDTSADEESLRQDREGELMARDAGKIIARIRKVNLYVKQINVAQFNALMSDANAEKVERFIWNGSWSSAKYLISNFPENFYSASEKQMILSYIDEVSENITREIAGV